MFMKVGGETNGATKKDSDMSDDRREDCMNTEYDDALFCRRVDAALPQSLPLLPSNGMLILYSVSFNERDWTESFERMVFEELLPQGILDIRHG